jgi:hypothetical protein
MAPDPVYIYLSYGPSPQTPRELRYSVETLLPEIREDASRIAVFTDRPENFRDLPVRVIDAAADLAGLAVGEGYRHRAKPLMLARAVRLCCRPCVLLDADSFVRQGFDATVKAALAAGAAMNAFVRADPYPDFGPFETDLPHLGRYVLDRERAVMFNSGLVAARPEHAPLLDDAVVLIERLWSGGLRRHDIEQFAISECFRLGGVPIQLIDGTFEHYFPRWSKRYFRRKLRARWLSGTAAPIPFSKARVRLFKAGRLLRLGLGRARRRLFRRPTVAR